MFDFDIEKLSIEEKIGQMIGLAFSGTEFNEELRIQLEEIKAGLIIFFKDNCDNPEQIFKLNKEINKHSSIPPFISLDQEGGMVARVTSGIVQSPGAMAISAGSSADAAYKLAYNMGFELKQLGFNFNFAPVADINNNQDNPVINVRSYSENPFIVSDYMLEATKGYNDAGLMTSAKHFPGHGDTSTDSHLGLPVVDFDLDRLHEVELIPFKKCINHNLPGIMASHILYSKIDSEYPATLSNKVIQKFLREDLGFDGLVVTDSLTMKAVWGRYSIEEVVLRTFNSGCDIMLLCGARDIEMQKEFYNTAVRLAKEGVISQELIDKAVRRIFRYKKQFVEPMASEFKEIENNLLNKERVEYSKKVMEQGVTMLGNGNGLLPVTKDDKVLVVFPEIKVVTLVENEDNSLNSLAEYLPFKVDKVYVPLEPDFKESRDIINKVKDYDKVIFCSYNAIFYESQRVLINSIETDKLIVCGLRTPYDYNVIRTDVFITAYEATALAFEALSKVLTGQLQATGKCPVSLIKKEGR